MLHHHYHYQCFVKEIGLRFWRSWWRQMFRISKKQFPDDTFRNAGPFVIIRGMVRHHYNPMCHMEDWFAIFKGQGHSEDSYIKVWLLPQSFPNCWFFCKYIWYGGTLYYLKVIMFCEQTEFHCCVWVPGHRKGSKCPWMLWPNMSWFYHHKPWCHAEGIFCYLQDKGHTESSYKQNIISSEVLIRL